MTSGTETSSSISCSFKYRVFIGVFWIQKGRTALLTARPCLVFLLAGLLDPGQFLQQSPVFQPLLVCCNQQCAGVAVLIEMLGETAFRARERDEVHGFAGLGIDVPVVFHVGIAGQT